MARFKPLISLPATLGGWTLFLAFFARLLSPVTADLSFIILAVYAFKGRSQAIQALSLSWFFVMLNPGFAPDASYATIGRYLVLFSAALSVAMRKNRLRAVGMNNSSSS
ncbi:hypothetical protein [Chlorobium phaeovibrioides]|uniref:hypothetical protein n=1 Tax=Chlorobium phaeovibrioides TaxID=1094 RepID=UPI00123180B5|nr:hypothetical protein [Chlorobium phaeovibrioides]QEQ57224.1 hypothetical protein FNV82_06320 [Chlorobium phaeovibrioides]